MLFGVELGVGGASLEAALGKALPQDHDVTVSLLRWWARVMLAGFRRAHAELRKESGLSALQSGAQTDALAADPEYRSPCGHITASTHCQNSVVVNNI